MEYKQTVYKRYKLSRLIRFNKNKIILDHEFFIDKRIKFRYRYDSVPGTRRRSYAPTTKFSKGLVFATMKNGNKKERTMYWKILCNRFEKVFANKTIYRNSRCWKHQKKIRKQYMKKFI